MHDLTGIQRDLLYSIARLNRPNGLEVGAELEEYSQIEINSAQLSPNLDSMVHKGLVEKDRRDNRANWDALTAKGRQKIEARREWEAQYTSLED